MYISRSWNFSSEESRTTVHESIISVWKLSLLRQKGSATEDGAKLRQGDIVTTNSKD
jgi:hypothetical protein